MMKLFDFIFAARPLLHLPVWTVYLVTRKLLSPDSGFDLYDLLSIAALNLLFAGAFYYNQIQDEESDRKNQKLGFLQRKMISSKSMMAAFVIVSVVGVALGFLNSTRIGLLMVCVMILSIVYSHPLFRFKDRAWLGLFSNMTAHGALVSIAAFPYPESMSSSLLCWLLTVYFSLTVGSIYLMTTIADAEGDGATGKKTITVAYGPRLTMLLALGMALASVPIALYGQQWILAGLAMLAALLIFFALITNNSRIILLSTKLPLLLLTILAGYFYWGYLLFVIALLIATRIYYQRRFDLIYPKLA